MDQGTTAMPIDGALCQCITEPLTVVEFRHLHMGTTDLARSVRVAAGAAEEPVFLGKAPGLRLGEGEWQSPGIKHFDNVKLGSEIIQRLALLVYPSHVVEWMGQTHQSLLLLDSSDSLFGRDAAGDFFGKEEPHYLPDRCQNLLTNDHLEGGDLLHLEATGYGAVVCYGNAVDPDLQTAVDDGLQRHAAIEGVLGVNVKVSLEQMSPCPF